MPDREEIDHYQGVPTERVWKEYTAKAILTFHAYEGDELAQAEALAAFLDLVANTGHKVVRVELIGYPEEV